MFILQKMQFLDAISRPSGHKIVHNANEATLLLADETTQAQYIELVMNNAPVAQLDNASAF